MTTTLEGIGGPDSCKYGNCTGGPLPVLPQGRGGGSGTPKVQNFMYRKIAQINVSFCKFHFFALSCGLVSPTTLSYAGDDRCDFPLLSIGGRRVCHHGSCRPGPSMGHPSGPSARPQHPHRAVLNRETSKVTQSPPKSAPAHHALAVGGWRLGVDDWRLVTVDGWGLVVDGGWRSLLAIGGGWWFVAVGGWRLMVPWGGP